MMARGEIEFEKLVDFVGNEIEYFEDKLDKPRDDFDLHEWGKVVSDCVWIMSNIAMYDDADEILKLDQVELVEVAIYCYDEEFVDDEMYHLLECGINLCEYVGLAVKGEILNEQ